jgi:hypothetical protein
MLTDLLRIITPDALAAAIRGNPRVVQAALQKFEAYSSLGQAMTTSQQVCVSNNLDKLTTFFQSPTGKGAVHSLADEFVKFINTTTVALK